MKNAHDVLRRALISEKGTRMREAGNKYMFEVQLSSNKIEIKRAVEEAFGVTVVQVHTQTYLGKIKRLGASQGRRPEWKRAIVKLKDGDLIDLFEEV